MIKQNNTKKDLNKIREVIFDYTKIKTKDWDDVNVTKDNVEEAVFLIDGEIRIGGECASDFSYFFVNYYDLINVALEMANFVEKETKGKFIVEWYNPAYMVAYKQ